jgi:hypothetical protein
VAKQTMMPKDRVAPEGGLAIWVIYHRPKDYPDGYVLRCQYAMPDGTVKADSIAWQTESLEDARRLVPIGFTKMARHDDDDPHIVETWI